MSSNKRNIILHPLTEKDFTDFFHNWYSSLCFFANKYLKDFQAAEDVVIEVAANIWEKKEMIQNVDALQNYFYTSVRNACIRFLQNKKRKSSKLKELTDAYVLQERTVLENIIHTEVLRQIEEALNHLPTQCRKVFTKLYIEEKTISEVANELQLSPNTIKTHRKRGLKLLRSSISGIFWLLLQYLTMQNL